jgi:SPX domain protein involved in polyphosphate accumulation
VNTFYTEKSANLDERLKVLVENVYSLAAESDSEGQSVSERAAMIKEAQTASEVKTLSDVLRMGIKRVLDRRTTSNPLERLSEQTISLMDTEGSDDEDGHNISSRKKKSVKETDSVKRAMIDLHRSSKLLNNYSIMNYTGFVKIVKKFDKSFPDHKGEFKNIVSESLCHDGKEAENLADEMVRNIILNQLLSMLVLLFFGLTRSFI